MDSTLERTESPVSAATRAFIMASNRAGRQSASKPTLANAMVLAAIIFDVDHAFIATVF